ncbi:interferon gamma receptor 1 [Rhinophrynus dorsalis]
MASYWTILQKWIAAVLLFFLIQQSAEGNQRFDLNSRKPRESIHNPLTNASEPEVMDQAKPELKVPTPFDLTIKSYNFNTTLYWDYNITSAIPHFQVEIWNFTKEEYWTIVDTCKNIFQNYCDLSQQIIDPGIFYHVRVKAFVGSAESEYAIKKDFCLRIHGSIGPPTLNASFEDKEIVVDIWHPLTPLGEHPWTIRDFYSDFQYEVFVKNNNAKIIEQECYSDLCTIYILPLLKDETYCISALGSSADWVVEGEISNEICIYVDDEQATKGFRAKVGFIAALCIFFFVLLMVILLIFAMKVLQKNSFTVPKSLNFMLRTRGAHIIMHPEEEPKYDHVTTYFKERNLDKLNSFEEESSVNEMSNHSVSGQADDPEYQKSHTGTEEQQTYDEHDTKFVEDANDSNRSSSYFHADSNKNECVAPSDSETLEDNTEEETCSDVKPPTNSYGYDKPHVPLHLLIQMNNE